MKTTEWETRDLIKKVGDIKRPFHANDGHTIKDRNNKDLKEEEIKKR